MSEENTTEAEKEAISEADDNKASSSGQTYEVTKEERKSSTAGASFFSGLVGLLSMSAFVAVGLVGYFGYQQFLQMSERLITLEQLERNNQTEKQQAATILGNNFEKLQAQLQQSLNQQQVSNKEKLNDFSEQLSATQRQLLSVGGRHRNDWLLAEADYLVRIATNRLLLERDHQTALVLLVSADERIMLIDDPGLQPIREALSNDMAKLRLVKRADIAGLAIRISSLIPQLKLLPILAFQLPEETIEEIDNSASTPDQGWQQSLKNTFKELSVKWFEVRDHGRPVAPLMAPETEAILLTNMTLLLQTTQFAILRQHSELYQHSLQQLKEWSAEYFDISDPVVIAFINEIDLLIATTVSVELPKTLESRLLIARQVEQQFQQTQQSQLPNDTTELETASAEQP